MADDQRHADTAKRDDDTAPGAPEPVTPVPTPSTTAITEPLDDALTDPTLPRVPGTSAGTDRPA